MAALVADGLALFGLFGCAARRWWLPASRLCFGAPPVGLLRAMGAAYFWLQFIILVYSCPAGGGASTSVNGGGLA